MCVFWVRYIAYVFVSNIAHVYAYVLQAQFSQMRPVAMAPSLGPRMPMYPPGAPGIGQQLFYGSAPPAMIPPQVTIPSFSLARILVLHSLFFMYELFCHSFLSFVYITLVCVDLII